MNIKSFTNDDLSLLDYFKSLKADFIIGLSCTKTKKIVEDDFLDFVPTVDAEFISLGKIKSFDTNSDAAKYISHSAVFTRAVHLIKPYENIVFLNLGFKKRPRVFNSIFDFNIQPTNIINDNAMVEVEELFEKGLEFGKEYKPFGDYIILSANMPFSELSTHCSIQALGFEDKNNSFVNNKIVQDALDLLSADENTVSKLYKVSDNINIFLSGVLVSLCRNYKVVLSGGEEMLCLLLILDKLIDEKYMKLDYENLYIFSYNIENNENIDNLLSQLSFKPKGFYSTYDFNIQINDTNGLGASLIYSILNGISQSQIINQLEQL
jgi:hypothetical protein